MSTHTHTTSLHWAGTTTDYTNYSRTHEMTLGSTPLTLSADPAFLGNPQLINPQQLFLAAVSSCHLLAFLTVAARSGLDVLDYTDHARGETPDTTRPLRMTQIGLRPRVVVRNADVERAEALLHQARQQCDIANSITSAIVVEPDILRAR